MARLWAIVPSFVTSNEPPTGTISVDGANSNSLIETATGADAVLVVVVVLSLTTRIAMIANRNAAMEVSDANVPNGLRADGEGEGGTAAS
jgi:hypothetical protein